MTSTLQTPPVETTVGNHFVSNYPPFSVWRAEEIPRLEAALNREVALDEPISLYLHIPFCRQRCHYCYYRVYPRRSSEDVDRYISRLLQELELYLDRPAIGQRPFQTIYFGGGSPSYPSYQQLARLLAGLRAKANWDQVEEFTVECEPGTVSAEKFRLLHEFGVTRVSLGFQSLNDDIVRRSGRDVSARDCLDSYERARKSGIHQINIDLIAGLPGETPDTWRNTLDQVLELAPDCVTIYQLELTHNSNLYRSMDAGRKVELPTWPVKRAWTSDAFQELEQAGYTIASGYMAVRDPAKWRFAYTVDHFWQGEDLLALGESSFGHIQGVHYQNAHTFERYTSLVQERQLPWRRAYELNQEEKLRRELILQFKTGEVNAARFRQKFGIELVEHFGCELDILAARRLVSVNGDRLILSREALLDVDWWLPIFYLPHHQNVRYT